MEIRYEAHLVCFSSWIDRGGDDLRQRLSSAIRTNQRYRSRSKRGGTPGVEVTATQTETGIAGMAIPNETGLYGFPELRLGPYRFEAALPGFVRSHRPESCCRSTAAR